MRYEFTLYALPALFSSVVACFIAAYLWTQRKRRGALTLFLMTLFSAYWALFEAIELCAIGLDAKVFISNFRWVGVVSVPVFWLFFALRYTQTRPYDRWRWLGVLSIMPVTTLLLYWTNALHGVIRTSVWLDTSIPIGVIASNRGIWFSVHTFYSYLLIILGTMVLLRFMLMQTRFYRIQIAAITLAPLVPFMLNVVSQMRLLPEPWRHFDPTPSAMAISVVLIAWSLYRYRFLDLVPIARQRVVDELPDAVFVLDANGHIIDANPAATALTGESQQSLFGKEPAAALGVAPERLFRGEDSPGPWDLALEGADGRTTWVDVRFSFLHDGGQENSGQLVVLRDITARKTAEEKVHERERYLAAIHHISDLVVDTANGIPWAPIAAEIGESSGAAQAGILLASDPANPEAPFEPAAHWTAPGLTAEIPDLTPLLANGTVSRDQLDEGHYVRPESGPESERMLFPFHDGAGLRGVVWLESGERSRRDALAIAHLREGAARLSQALYRQRSQQEHQEMARQFQRTQKLESLGVLAGGIAHDFNNLLSMILGNAELARKDLEEGSPGRRRLANVERAAISASKLCSQMLTYAGQGSRTSQRVDLNEVVLEVKELLVSSAPKNAEIVFRLGAKIPPIEGDATQLQQILVNFVSNATEALGKDPGRIDIETGAFFCSPEYLREAYLAPGGLPGWTAYLEVRDTGCGMDPETLARIFEPFYTTKFTGRGLGLSAVLGIVRSHSGGMHVISEPGAGSTFRVFFPRLDAQAPPATDTPLRGHHTGERRFVLLVDDDQEVLNLTRHTLEQLGYNVLVANSGSEAVEACRFRQGEVSCAVIDLMMPGMDGVATCEALRKEIPGLPAVFASGLAEATARTRYEAIDGALFLQKPFRARALLEVLNQAVKSGADSPADQ